MCISTVHLVLFCFVYLGGLISSTGSSQPDVRRRIGLACDAVRRLAKIWKNKAISKETKVQVYETMVLSILCYNSETWTLTAVTNRQLRVFEMVCLRRIMDVTQRDHIKNVDIRACLDISRGYSRGIQARRLRYFGHVVRMGQHRLPNIALYGRVEGNRPKGRPRKRWLDNVTDDCYHRGWSIAEATHLATDRQCWRTYIRLSQRAPASP